MTWKKILWLIFFIMLSVWLALYFFIARLGIHVRPLTIIGLRSVFPAGDYSRIRNAENGWQGYGFTANFRLFHRVSPHARDDFQRLVQNNFSRSLLKQDLDLFGGGIYVLHKARKGYRMACLFFQGDTNYWADMFSANSLHFSRQAFEKFILNLEINGERASPAVARQIHLLHGKISPFLMQTPAQLLSMMAVIFIVILLIIAALNRFSGSTPRRRDVPAQVCTPWATMVVGGFSRRQVTACCLCLEGESLVVYRFRRPFFKIDMRHERQQVVWKKNSIYYKNFRVILAEDDFQNWRSRFL